VGVDNVHHHNVQLELITVFVIYQVYVYQYDI